MQPRITAATHAPKAQQAVLQDGESWQYVTADDHKPSAGQKPVIVKGCIDCPCEPDLHSTPIESLETRLSLRPKLRRRALTDDGQWPLLAPSEPDAAPEQDAWYVRALNFVLKHIVKG